MLVVILTMGAGCGGSEGSAKSADTVGRSLASHQITKVNPKVGFTMVTTESETMKFLLSVDGQEITVTETKRKEKRTEALAVEGSVITKAKISYIKMSERKQEGDQPAKVTAPLEGNSYILDATGREAEVDVAYRTAEGETVEGEELAALKGDNKSFGKPNRMFDALPTDGLKEGVRVPAIEAALKDKILEGEDEEHKFSNLKVSFDKFEGGAAVFAVALTLDRTVPGTFHMKFEPVGTMHIATDTGWPVRSTMNGTITFSPIAGAQKQFSGTGKANSTETRTYPQ